MNARDLAAALAGAAVTVTVFQGRALVQAGDADARVVEAGRTVTVGRRAPEPVRPTRTRIEPTPDEDPQQRIARLQREVEALKLQQTLARGALRSHEGVPQDWPDELPRAFEPASFEGTVRSALAETGMGELLDMDCEEYPCLALVRAPAALDDMEHPGRELADRLQAELDHDGPVHSSVWASASSNDEGEVRVLAVTVYPDAGDDTELFTRTRYRAEADMEDAIRQIRR